MKIDFLKPVIQIILLTSILILSCGRIEEKKSLTHKVDEILQMDFPAHYPENTKAAMILREIVKDYSGQKVNTDFVSFLKTNLYQEVFEKDSVLYVEIFNRIATDSLLLNDCFYLKKVLNCQEQYQSQHFTIYNLNSAIDTQKVAELDAQYEMLHKVFHSYENRKIDLVLDTSLHYWRSFPPWDIKYGLLQRNINRNPHELVHHFFTRFSDVPFFQEPMAFLFGDYRNDTAKFYNSFAEKCKHLSRNEYLKAKESWHFPAIVLLEETEKKSFWLFTTSLMQKYGIEKFIEFAKITTWDKSDLDFEKNFQMVYQMSLESFESKYIINKLE